MTTAEIANAAQDGAGATGSFTRASLPMWGTFAIIASTIIVRITPLYEVWRRMTMTATDKLIADLQSDGESLRAELREVRETGAADRAQCRAENDALRESVRALGDEVHGLRRQLVMQQVDRVVELAASPSAAVIDAAARVAKLP